MQSRNLTSFFACVSFLGLSTKVLKGEWLGYRDCKFKCRCLPSTPLFLSSGGLLAVLALLTLQFLLLLSYGLFLVSSRGHILVFFKKDTSLLEMYICSCIISFEISAVILVRNKGTF